MDSRTFKILKRAHKSYINEQELQKIKVLMPNPLMTDRINVILNNFNYNTKFTEIASKFSKLENSSLYKEDLVITYLLFLGKIMNQTFLIHTFHAPQSQNIFNWIILYKNVVYFVITLLFNKKFTDEDWLYLDIMIYSLNEGYVDSVRNFLKKLKIVTSNNLVDLEKKYNEMILITSDDFGPFYWRIIHFMAEAIQSRKYGTLAKSLWREFTIYSLHRTLICSICQEHYKTVVKKYKNELENTNTNYANLWFNIHNFVNATLNKPEYSLEEFQKDQSIIQNLL